MRAQYPNVHMIHIVNILVAVSYCFKERFLVNENKELNCFWFDKSNDSFFFSKRVENRFLFVQIHAEFTFSTLFPLCHKL